MNRPEDFIIENRVLKRYAGPGGDVTVPEGVTRIGDRAFYGCTALRSLRLPEGLTAIGEEACAGCLLLSELRLPESLRSIGHNAFLACIDLGPTRLPKGLRHIGESAFYECHRLSVDGLPEDLEELGDWAFANCGSLRRIVLPRKLTRLAPGTFSECGGLEEAVLPVGLREIGLRAFAGCVRLRRAVLPPGPLRMGEEAFAGCRALADGEGFLILQGVLFGYFGPRTGTVTLPEGVTRIDGGAFGTGEGLLDLRLPDSAAAADPDAFYREDLILRLRQWQPGLEEALTRCARLILVTESGAGVPQRFRRAALIGAALKREPSPEEAAWLARNSLLLAEDAFRIPAILRFLCGHRLIRPRDLDEWLERAREAVSPELTARLLNYGNELGPELEAARKQRRKQEDVAAEIRTRRLAGLPEKLPEHLRVVVAGPRPLLGAHPALRARLEALGARIVGAVIPEADLLVTDGPEAEPEKQRKAEALGIPVVSLQELEALLPEEDEA